MMQNMMRKIGLAALLVGPALVAGSGCDKLEEAQGALCCKEFEVGANLASVEWDVDANVKADFSAFMQASADFSGAASGLVLELSTVCRELALDLGENEDAVPQPSPGNPRTPGQDVEDWCGKVGARLKAAGSIKIVAQPPQCAVSLSAQAQCQGSCSAQGKCEVDPGTIQCEGGELSFTCSGSCSGKCKGSAELAVSCKAACSGTCEGTCSGTCQGKCDGKDSSGSCAGTCEGTCEGSCTGKCSGTCDASGDASVECEGECSGSCSGKASAPKCSGKPPQLNCEASAECKGSCQASAQAKAECTPGTLKVTAAGSLTALQIASIEAYLPRIRALLEGKVALLKPSAQAIITLGGQVGANGGINAKAVPCIASALSALGKASGNLEAAFNASGSITSSVSTQ